MFETLSSAFFWISLAIVVVFGILAIDRIVRGLVDRFNQTPSCFPHRVANQLPRALHKGDFDETIELEDDAVVDHS